MAIARAMPSAEAPGANGTMMRMGFWVWAKADPLQDQQREQQGAPEAHDLLPEQNVVVGRMLVEAQGAQRLGWRSERYD